MVKGWCALQGVHARGMHSRGHAWQERWPLQQMVRILLECILVLHVFKVFNKVINLLYCTLYPKIGSDELQI